MTFLEQYAKDKALAFKFHPDAKDYGWNVSYLTGKRLYRFFVDHKERVGDESIHEWKLRKEQDEKRIRFHGGDVVHKSQAWEYTWQDLPAEVQKTKP